MLAFDILAIIVIYFCWMFIFIIVFTVKNGYGYLLLFWIIFVGLPIIVHISFASQLVTGHIMSGPDKDLGEATCYEEVIRKVPGSTNDIIEARNLIAVSHKLRNMYTEDITETLVKSQLHFPTMQGGLLENETGNVPSE